MNNLNEQFDGLVAYSFTYSFNDRETQLVKRQMQTSSHCRRENSHNRRWYFCALTAAVINAATQRKPTDETHHMQPMW